jgi:hypothetical protein
MTIKPAALPQGDETMDEKRCNVQKEPGYVMKRELSEDQRVALGRLEAFGWELKFVRRPLFQHSVAVVFDSDRKHFAVLEEDGMLNENPGFTIRH